MVLTLVKQELKDDSMASSSLLRVGRQEAIVKEQYLTTTTTTTSLFLTLKIQISHHLQIARLIEAGGV